MPFNYSEHVPVEHRRELLNNLRSGTLFEIYRQSILLGIEPTDMSADWDPDSAGFTEGSAVRQTALNLKTQLDQLAMIERLLTEPE